MLALEVHQQLEKIAETKPSGFVEVEFGILEVTQVPLYRQALELATDPFP